MDLVYAQERDLSVADYVAVLGSTYMKDKRPLANAERIARILGGSNVIVTARDRDSGEVVGLARGISDNEWVCYLADLVVHADHQGKGIGSALLAQCRRLLGPGVGIILVAYPEAEAFYRRIGLGEMPAFYIDRTVST